MALALVNARVHGHAPGTAVVIADGRIAATPAERDLPTGMDRRDLGGLMLAPGFIDTQVNGGGGALFNADPSVRGIAAIGAAHRRFGTTGFLPTLITDTADQVDRAMRAVEDAIEAGVPGVLGIHLEGPHLAAGYRGVHDAAKFRPIDEATLDLICSLRRGITMLTLAPETVPDAMLRELIARGVIVSAGHTAADYAQMRAAFGAGVRGVTHLFNAMSPLTSRTPGTVGAVLEDRDVWAGIIVDGIHVHPATLRIALAARPRERFMLVTDAMTPAGTDATSFLLDGREIMVRGEACYTADGVLAGSALTMAGAVANAEQLLGVTQAAAIDMASAAPAAFLGLSGERGRIAAGCRADLLLIGTDRRVVETWIADEVD